MIPTVCLHLLNASQFPELELSREDVVHEVVKVGAINETLSLEARVHGYPAVVAGVPSLSLHEGPHRLPLDWHRFLPWDHEDLTNHVQNHVVVEELTCAYVGKQLDISSCVW